MDERATTDHVDAFALVRTSDDFRRVIATGEHLQLVAMTLGPGEEIGSEVHDDVDQALLFLNGDGEVVLDDTHMPVSGGHLVLVRAGVRHNVVASGSGPLGLLTAYAPPEHPDGTVHATKAEADAHGHDH